MWVFKKPTNMVARIALTIISACILINAFIINPSDSHQSETNQQPAAETQQTENAPDGPKATLQSIEALYTGSTEAGTLIDSGADGMKVTATYSDGTSEEVTGWTIDHSEALVAGATSTFTISYQDKTCTVDILCTTLDEASYKASCVSYGYEDLARSPDAHVGEDIVFTGEVIQVMEDSTGSIYRINITQGDYGIWQDTVLVLMAAENAGESRILEDDIVTVYGTFTGLYTYTSTFGASITVPSVAARYIDIN